MACINMENLVQQMLTLLQCLAYKSCAYILVGNKCVKRGGYHLP